MKTKMNFDVGQYWLTRGGHIAEITETFPGSLIYAATGKIIGSTSTLNWYEEGITVAHTTDIYDLVEQISKDEYPEYFL